MPCMLLYDAVQSCKACKEFTAFTIQDVDTAFAKVVPVRYSQPLALSGKCKGIIISAYNAGHSLGGSIWKIRKDTDEVVYAVDFNHMKERHLSKGTILSDVMSRPSILITDCLNANVVQMRRRQRDELLFRNGYQVIHLFRHVSLLHRISELEKFRGPKVVVASFPGLELGFARDLLLEWSRQPDNTVILTDRALNGTLAREMYDVFSAADNPTQIVSLNAVKDLEVSRAVELQGEELAEFRMREAEKKEKEAAEEAARNKLGIMEEDSDLSDEEDAVETSGKASTAPFDLYIKDTTKTSHYFKQSQSFKMFPCTEIRPKVDDYGEVIDPTTISGDDAKAQETSQMLDEIGLDLKRNAPLKLEDEKPVKYITEQIQLELRCKLIYVDFEGRVDGRSLKEIITQLAPRKLVSRSIEKSVKENPALTNDVFLAATQTWQNISVATNVYQAARVADYEVALVPAFVRESDYNEQESDANVPAKHGPPVLDLLPPIYRKSRIPVVVGEIRLSEFRRVLADNGFATEFVEGCLVVNKSLVVRKTPGGKLAVEGRIGSDYFKLRSLLYHENVIVR
ncbi:cleavage and polyadenylation specificity factor subunit 2 [Phlyctochytrium bullatum]|nr:cleavage and polyadenylation specificity factor subunit 2 [Phlyctochytrium bullatum]